MNNGIELNVSNSLRRVLNLTGESKYQTGTTMIEAESSRDGNKVRLYIQNKGFGCSSSKSVTTTLDNEAAAELMAFLQRHLELSAKAEAMRKAGDGAGE